MEKKLYHYLFLVFFAFLTGYTFLIRASFYDEDGLPRQNQGVFRVIGENLAGDYAFFRLLEQKNDPSEAVQPDKVSAFLKKTAQIEGRFHSLASPMKAFLSVPFLPLAYEAFCETWIFWGLVLFGFALYSLFPLKKTLLLMFAFPAVFLSFATGGWGVFIASFVILALTLTEDYPKAAAFFAALCVIEPVAFVAVLTVFIARRQTKAALYGSVSGLLIVWLAWARYGAEAFKQTFMSAWNMLSGQPYLLASFSSTLVCNGVPCVAALIAQSVLVAAVVFFGGRLFRKASCPQAVQDAYVCAALCLISPFSGLGDYGMLYAGIAFLLRDMDVRGSLKGEIPFLFVAFFSIYLEKFWMGVSGSSIQMWLAVALLMISCRRSD